MVLPASFVAESLRFEATPEVFGCNPSTPELSFDRWVELSKAQIDCESSAKKGVEFLTLEIRVA